MALKILLADDSMTAQKMGKEILVAAGHEVITVSNGAAAVKKIASEHPDIAVLDVYMPGYTGLEVCERIKSDPATARTPVLLTVGKMEAYNPQDGAKAKADGVIIKPFEATDLVAAIQKLSEAATAAAAPPPPAPEPEAAPYQKTAKFNVKELLAQDPSYKEWTVSAPEHTDDTMESGAVDKKNVDVPQDMASSPAFGYEEESTQTPPPMPAPPPMAMAATAIVAPSEHGPVEMEMSTAPPPAPLKPARDPHLEPTSAKDTSEVEHKHDPMFEPTVSQEHIEVPHSTVDPGLITDPDQMHSEFKTRFGVDNPEPISVGVAADIPGLYDDAHMPAAEEVPPTQDVTASAEKVEQKVEEGKTDFDKAVAEAMSAFDSQKIKAVEEHPPVVEEPKPEAAHIEEVPATIVEKAEELPATIVQKVEEAGATLVEAPATVIQAAEALPPTQKFEPPTQAVEPMSESGKWAAHSVPLDDHEHKVSLEDEMQKAFAAAAHAEPEPEPAPQTVVAPPATVMEPAPVEEKQAQDLKLAEEMAAAIGAEKPMSMAAAAGAEAHEDHERIMTAVHNVFEKLKPEILEQIRRELREKK